MTTGIDRGGNSERHGGLGSVGGQWIYTPTLRILGVDGRFPAFGFDEIFDRSRSPDAACASSILTRAQSANDTSPSLNPNLCPCPLVAVHFSLRGPFSSAHLLSLTLPLCVCFPSLNTIPGVDTAPFSAVVVSAGLAPPLLVEHRPLRRVNSLTLRFSDVHRATHATQGLISLSLCLSYSPLTYLSHS